MKVFFPTVLLVLIFFSNHHAFANDPLPEFTEAVVDAGYDGNTGVSEEGKRAIGFLTRMNRSDLRAFSQPVQDLIWTSKKKVEEEYLKVLRDRSLKFGINSGFLSLFEGASFYVTNLLAARSNVDEGGSLSREERFYFHARFYAPIYPLEPEEVVEAKAEGLSCEQGKVIAKFYWFFIGEYKEPGRVHQGSDYRCITHNH